MQNDSERISTSPEQTVSQLFDLVKSFEHKLAEQQTTFESENKQLQEKVSRLETALQHKNLEVAAELGEVRTSRRRLFKKMGVAAAGALAAGTLAVTTNLPAAEAASGPGNISFNGEGAPVAGATPNYNRTDGTTTFSTTNPPLAGGALPGTSSIEIYNNRPTGNINGLYVRTQSNSGVPITGQSDTSGAASGLIGIAGTVAGFTPEVGVDPASAGVTGNSSVTTGVYGVSSSLTGAGVYGLSQNGVGVIGKSLNSFGGQFSTKLANKGQLYIKPSGTPGVPAVVSPLLGEIYVDSKGVAYIYMDDGSGTPAWKNLAVANPAVRLYYLTTPDRFLDTRDPAIGQQPANVLGPWPNGKDLDVTIVSTNTTTPEHPGRDGRTIPSTAIAVVGNVTALPIGTGGLLKVLPGGTPRPTGTSTVNFNTGFNTANAFNAKLSSGGILRIQVWGTTSAHFIIDIVGYYA